MSHTYAQNHLHVVFSTKERHKLIEKHIQPKLWSYMAGIGRNHDFLVLVNGGIGGSCSSADSDPAGSGFGKGRGLVEGEFFEVDE